MASIRGTDTNVILKQGTTHGTAVTGGSTDKLPVESIQSMRNASELSSNEIGTGLSMATDLAIGETTYSVDITMQAGYNNGAETWLAIFMGSVTAPAEQNVGEGDYLHVIKYLASVKKFATIAYDSTSSTVIEHPSCYPSNLSISTSPFNYIEVSGSWVANTKVISGTTNSNASLASATIANPRKIVAQRNDLVLVNAEGGDALDSGDAINCSNVSFNFNDEKVIQNTFSGSDSAGAPIRSDLFNGDFTLEFLELTDHTWLNYRDNETALKLSFIVEGAQIAAGDNYKFAVHIPRFIVTQVDYSIGSSGVNGFTVTCRMLKASTAPTGMADTYPHFEFVNTQSTALIS